VVEVRLLHLIFNIDWKNLSGQLTHETAFLLLSATAGVTMRTQRGTRPCRVRIKAPNDTTPHDPTGVARQSRARHHRRSTALFSAGAADSATRRFGWHRDARPPHTRLPARR